MKDDKLDVDAAECIMVYTKNQFSNEFNHIMEKDESKTLKY